MAAYVVNAQVAGVRPRRAERAPAVVARPVAPSRPAATPPATPTAVPTASADSEMTIDLVGRPLEAVLRDRWARIGEIWAQTTFYLFDPDSWR